MNDISAEERRSSLGEASVWLIRLQDEAVSDTELEAWGRWMAESPKHAAAFDDLSALWDASGALDSAALLRARENRTSRQQADAAVIYASRDRRWSPKWVAGLAASVIAAAGALFLITKPTPPTDIAQVYATSIGERRQVVLPDGSRVDLDAATEAAVVYRNDRRDIELRRGQAFFTVVSAPNRPFVVTANGVQSRAVGTRFAVSHRANQGLEVTVVEGRVRIGMVHTKYADSPQVDALSGQRVTFSALTGLEPPREVNAALATAWREGIVVYQGEPLANVIDDLNRYSRVPIRLQDPALGHEKVTGRWELADTDRWLDGLAAALRMHITRKAGEIVLSRSER